MHIMYLRSMHQTIYLYTDALTEKPTTAPPSRSDVLVTTTRSLTLPTFAGRAHESQVHGMTTYLAML